MDGEAGKGDARRQEDAQAFSEGYERIVRTCPECGRVRYLGEKCVCEEPGYDGREEPG